MPRTTIAAVLAMLLLVAPAASARPLDAGYGAHTTPEHGYPAYPTPEVTNPKVMPERVTDHAVPKPDRTDPLLAWERYYESQGDAIARAALMREQESTSGSGNQGLPAGDDDSPWVIAGGIAGAALLAGALTLVARRTRTRVAA